MKSNIKGIFGIILLFLAGIGLLACLIWAMVLRFQNVDMTELRMFIEHPGPSIYSIVCLIVGKIGLSLLGDKKY